MSSSIQKITFISLTLFLTACASYKVIPQNEIAKITNHDNLVLERENKFPQGKHCFEPMLYVLTLGLIPTHCENTYLVQENEKEIGKVTVTSMNGWVVLLLAPTETWNFGEATESDIKNSVTIKQKNNSAHNK